MRLLDGVYWLGPTFGGVLILGLVLGVAWAVRVCGFRDEI